MFQFPAGASGLSFQSVQANSLTHPAFCLVISVASFPQATVLETNHSLPSSGMVNEWSYTCTHGFHRANFHYRTHKHLPPVSILGQPNPVHIPTSHLLEICLCLQSKHPACACFLTEVFYRVGLLAPRPTPKLEDHPSSAVRDCLFSLFAATLLMRGRSSIHNLRTRHAVVTETHYIGYESIYFFKLYLFLWCIRCNLWTSALCSKVHDRRYVTAWVPGRPWPEVLFSYHVGRSSWEDNTYRCFVW